MKFSLAVAATAAYPQIMADVIEEQRALRWEGVAVLIPVIHSQPIYALFYDLAIHEIDADIVLLRCICPNVCTCQLHQEASSMTLS